MSYREVLGLYRQLVRYGQNLTLTDKDYFYRRIRFEFERYRNTSDPRIIEKQLQRGRALLTRSRVI